MAADDTAPRAHRPHRIGLVLGSGAARGWAHVGVIQGLEEAGIRPDCVCGSSIGGVIGALYAAGRLDAFEGWGRQLDVAQIVGYLDLSLRGGLIKARKAFDFLAQVLDDRTFEGLETGFGAVATDLATGDEVWLREGSIVDALRATTALPGLVTPAYRDGRWLVDGGLVNPVPVSLARAMGADLVIAVDLNATLVGRRLQGGAKSALSSPAPESGRGETGGLRSTLSSLVDEIRQRIGSDSAEEGGAPPTLYEVLANSINIMQVRISRSRMAGDPPDLLVTPQLDDFGLLDFDRAGEAITEGRRALTAALAADSRMAQRLGRAKPDEGAA